MTNTASKHGLRAAAEERRNKHAQRTPLPARPGEVQEARDLGVGAPEPKRYGEMTVVQLKAEAKALGLVTYTLRTKGALLTAILAKIQEPAEAVEHVDAKIDAQMAQETAASEPAEALVTEPAPRSAEARLHRQTAEVQEELLTSKSGRKANAFADKAEALGWKTQLSDSQTMQDIVACYATRGAGEAITIEWEDGVFNNQTCFHTTPGGRALKLRNASHALKRMGLQPVEVAREDTKVGIHTTTRSARRTAVSATDSAPHAPYFAEDVSDAEVLASVDGKTITWVNAISGALDSDRVSGNARDQVKILPSNSGRVINFLGAAGFRTVRVSSIVSL